MVHKTVHGVSGMARVLIFCAPIRVLDLPSFEPRTGDCSPASPRPTVSPRPLTTLRTATPLPAPPGALQHSAPSRFVHDYAFTDEPALSSFEAEKTAL